MACPSLAPRGPPARATDHRGEVVNRPWFPFYAADWLADLDVAAMWLAEQGAYMRLLAFQWREGAIPSEPARICRLLGAPYPVTQPDLDLDLVLAKFPGGKNARLERERQYAE